ncbi:MAG: OsmC family protein [Dehalococcoidia bacterium]
MSENTISTQVTSYSMGKPGRTLNTARNNHFVIDSPTLGEALGSGEAFLAGVSSCGVTLIEGAAQRTGVSLPRLEVGIEGIRSTDRPMDFQRVTMRFTFTGVSRQQADELVRTYQAN